MNIQEFAAKIRLHPCASVRVGRVMDREKSTGEAKVKFSGLQPHYATAGCPMVEWAGDRPLPFDNGAQVEFHFEEDQAASFPGMERGSWIPYSALRKGTLVQLTYGRQGVAPTLGAYRVLREAGFLLNKIKASGKKVFLVSYSWLSPGTMGSVVGRNHLLGIFSLEGEPLFISPEAMDNGVFQAEWPEDQKERTVAGNPAAHAAIQADAAWYEELKGVILTFNPKAKGDELHQSIIKARAAQLVQRNLAPDLESAIITAAMEAQASATAAATPAPAAAPKATPKATPASSRAASGKALLGKKR